MKDTDTDVDWKTKLSREQYAVLRKHATEYPWSSPLNGEKRDGVFACAGCGTPLFASTDKYESGSGWPSFSRPLETSVETTVDRSLGMERTEVHCATCAGHLGHVFDDGPQPTGLRYCINGAALDFRPEKT